MLLSIDLGVKTGIALFDKNGELLMYRSQNFGNIKRLKRGIYGLLNDLNQVEVMYVEGGGKIAKLWEKECLKRKIQLHQIHAQEWRKDLFHANEYLNSDIAKQNAIKKASAYIHASNCKKSKALVHDAAEAILIGIWGVKEQGWITAYPEEVAKK